MAAKGMRRSILKEALKDHNDIKSYFKEYTKFRSNGQYDEAKKWYHQWAWEVARHSVAEEIVIYPFMEKKLNPSLSSKNRSQHQEVKEQISRLESLTFEGQEFDAVINETMKALTEHMKLEEQDEFPELERVASPEEIDSLSQTFEHRKRIVPTRAHPNAPDTPPLETVVGLLAAPLDKFRDMFRDFPNQESVEAATKKE